MKFKLPTVNGRKQPVAVLEHGERMDGDGGDHEQEVEHCQGHQQAVKWIFPQLQYGIVLLLKKSQYRLSQPTCGEMSTIMDKVLPRKPTIPIREKRTPSTSLKQIKSMKVHKSQTININNSPLELSPLHNVLSTPAIQTSVE